MLVLSRRPSEEIIIGDNIRITIVQIAGGRVKLGVSAPQEVPVHRSEVRDRVRHSGAPGTEPYDPDAPLFRGEAACG